MSESPLLDNDIPSDPADLDGRTVTVDELNAKISTLIENTSIVSFDYLVGDVTDKSDSDGTNYFQLVHDECSVQCLVFPQHQSQVPEFSSEDRVAVKGTLNFYAKESECTIYVKKVILLGDSERNRRIKKRKEKLKKEGLCDEENKRQLPKCPRKIGIVTSKGSDGEKDAINAVHDQYDSVDIGLFDAKVQGKDAVEEICKGVMYFDSQNDIDIIIVTRGGGSEKDLAVFNTLGIARVIAHSDTPVVTAIGHENDTPLVDEVADLRAMTPTELGEIVVPDKENLLNKMNELNDRLEYGYTNIYTGQINKYNKQLVQSYTSITNEHLDNWRSKLDAAADKQISISLADYENELHTVFNEYKQNREHEEEKKQLQQKTTQLQIIAILLALFLLLSITIIWLLM